MHTLTRLSSFNRRVSTLTASLVSFWKLTDLADSYGANTLTNNNAVTFAAGKVGNAANFAAASSQYLSRADNATLRLGGTSFTIAFWVNLANKSGTRALVTKYDPGANKRSYELDYTNATDRFRFVLSSDGLAGTTVVLLADNFGAPAAGVWYFVVVTYTLGTGQMSISVNNGTANTATLSGGAFNGDNAFAIGARFNSGAVDIPHDGLIDAVGIWKRVLTNTEIAYLYNSGTGREPF